MRVPSGWHTALRLWSRKVFCRKVFGVITMYAVIATGGKQYRVEKGTVLKVERLDAEPGATVSFGEVLLLADGENIKVGSPLLKGGKVEAVVEKHGKGDKKVIVKFRRRK